MTDPTPTELDQGEAAKAIEQAGIADESAAIVSADDRSEEKDAEAHPS